MCVCMCVYAYIHVYDTLIVRETLLEGDVCPDTGTTGILILDFFEFLNHRSKMLSIICFFFLMGSPNVTLTGLELTVERPLLCREAILLPLPLKY